MINSYPFQMSPKVKQKLVTKHGITEKDVFNAFENREGSVLNDTREEHATIPPSQWFVSQLDDGRYIKVVFMLKAGLGIVIKTAYVANADEIRIYNALL